MAEEKYKCLQFGKPEDEFVQVRFGKNIDVVQLIHRLQFVEKRLRILEEKMETACLSANAHGYCDALRMYMRDYKGAITMSEERHLINGLANRKVV